MCNMTISFDIFFNTTNPKKFGWWGDDEYVNVDVDFSYSLSLFS
jgi:hypothetical protein